MGCSKQFSITVEEGGSPCDLFEDLIWGAPVIASAGGGSASGSGIGDSANALAESPDGVEGAFGEIEITGTVSYTGDSIDCCLTVNFQSLEGLGAWGVQIWHGPPFGGSLLLAISESAYAVSNPFTIPLTVVATNITVVMTVSAGGGESPFPAGAVSLNITVGGCA